MKDNYYFLINSLEGGGAERVTVNFAHDLLQKGKDVYIVTLKSTNFYDLPQGAHHVSLSTIRSNFLMFLLIPWYVWKFKKVLKKYHLSDGMSLLEIANFVHILAKDGAIISFRTHINFFTGIVGCIQKILIKRLYPRAGKIVVNSLENRHDLAEYLHVSESVIEVVYNTIDKDEVEKLRQEKISNDISKKIQGKRVFVTTGRLIRQKHHEKILEALAKVYSTVDKNRIYLIVGDGPRRLKLEALVKNLGLGEHTLFLGEQKNVFKYLNVANAFLYASEVEGFPNVLLEAKEMGLLIITSDFKSGAKEVILGEYNKAIGKKIQYPYEGKYGFLIDSKVYKHQFLDVYKNILPSIGK